MKRIIVAFAIVVAFMNMNATVFAADAPAAVNKRKAYQVRGVVHQNTGTSLILKGKRRNREILIPESALVSTADSLPENRAHIETGAKVALLVKRNAQGKEEAVSVRIL